MFFVSFVVQAAGGHLSVRPGERMRVWKGCRAVCARLARLSWQRATSVPRSIRFKQPIPARITWSSVDDTTRHGQCASLV